jgi:Holliday junction DNA helicase RuvB
MNKDHLMTSMAIKEDEEQSLRPEKLNQYIGQDDIKDMLSIYIQAAKKTQRTIRSHAIIWSTWFRENHIGTSDC